MFTEAERLRAIELYFKYGRKLAPVVRELKEICDAGSVYGKRVTVPQKPYTVSPVTLMCKSRLLLNIILTTVAAWRLPAGLSVIPAVMYWLAGLMNVIPADGLFSPVRSIKMHLLNLS